MYCVIYGILLNDGNQEGIICQRCKQRYLGEKSTRKDTIQVNHCHLCGASYHPSDASIQHCYQGLQQLSQYNN